MSTKVSSGVGSASMSGFSLRVPEWELEGGGGRRWRQVVMASIRGERSEERDE